MKMTLFRGTKTGTSLLQVIKALGGEIQLIRKPGVGHHPYGLDEPTPIAEFLFFNSQYLAVRSLIRKVKT